MKITWTCFVLVCFHATGALAAEVGLEARRILDDTGIRGGLIVHLGCGDGKLTAALHAGDSYLVQGLDENPTNVDKARSHIQSLGLGGRVSVAQFNGSRLPYVDNLVNLVVAEDLGKVGMDEVFRVLRPNGVAFVKSGGTWTKSVKPRPNNIDEWTHYLHDAGGNAVAHDTVVGPPRHMQWLAAPAHSRLHHTLASISSVVSSEGRIFYIMDESTPASMFVPSKWWLVARDAYNGLVLWNRPIESWASQFQSFSSGPVQLPRRLVAVGDRIYTTPGLNAPIEALSATTGTTVKTYAGTEGTQEILCHEGILLVVLGDLRIPPSAAKPPKEIKLVNHLHGQSAKAIAAIRADTGALLWKNSAPAGAEFLPMTLAAAGQRVFFQDAEAICCVDLQSGHQRWRYPRLKTYYASGVAPTLVAYQDLVFSAILTTKRIARGNLGNMVALSADTGKRLWSCEFTSGISSPGDLFVANGLVWTATEFKNVNSPAKFSVGRDPWTGEVKKRLSATDMVTAGHHDRCYRNKATDRFLVTGARGTEFWDLIGDNSSRNNWVRGCCQYGVMPCNGLLYAPPHACGCYMEAVLNGFWALAPERPAAPRDDAEVRLQKGPAYGSNSQSLIPNPSAYDWPTLRHDPLRSGSATVAAPAKLADVWHARLGGRLSAPVVAGGLVLVCDIDAGRVIALEADSGKMRWTYFAGGRVDSPPTIHHGLALFGSADGWVYALRAADGVLAWRFHAAPEELYAVAYDRLESVWPVHGSVLVDGGVAYCAAGRNTYLDGGIALYALDPATGTILQQSRVRTEHPKGDEGSKGGKDLQWIGLNATDNKTLAAPDKSDSFSMEGTRDDVLVSDGQSIFMHHLRFDRHCVRQEKPAKHLFSTTSLLDDAEFHRSFWMLGTGDFSRLPTSFSWIFERVKSYGGVQLSVPCGLMLCYDDRTVWSVRGQGDYTLSAVANRPCSPEDPPLRDFRAPDPSNPPSPQWSIKLSLRPRAAVRVGDRLLLGGVPKGADRVAAYASPTDGLLCVHATSDGSKIAERKLLSPPVWDGMAVAGHRVYVATADGQVLCLGE